ncbi:DUF6461 domain-containing protein [Actinoallomurus iriomotensis]|uniref:Uncharacterized protein n=1 Tax=Actinoallomurus iriomotensis TaxID=478107 RepID=A0A9W6RNX0_9ACTN|nr:DUF6461 domain-containing protein [Actinoallomurus iriomotensis]GLY77447.1 hypothetical protein Airi01_057140 [Actinoallomurus iriomotensis]
MSARHFDRYEELLGEIYCLTFVRGVDETGALLRMGGLADTIRPRPLAHVWQEMRSYEAGYPTIAQALNAGPWTVVIEPSGVHGSGAQLLNAVSRGTEAVSVLRHDYADDHLAYSVDGELVTELVGAKPAIRRGTEPDRILPQLRAAGLDPEGPDDGDPLIHPHVGILRLVGQITGFLPDLTGGPLASAHLEPWFNATEPSAVHRLSHEELADALTAVPASLRRTIAVREVRRLTELLDVAHHRDVSEALDTAEREGSVAVPAGSALGHRVRDWLMNGRRAHHVLTDPTERHRMTEEERIQATRLWCLAGALRGALRSDSPAGAFEALRPLIVDVFDWADDASHRATLLRELHTH